MDVFEVKERSGFRHNFLWIPDFHRFTKRIPFGHFFSENGILTVKTLELVFFWRDLDLGGFGVDFELTLGDVGSPREGP